MHKGQFEIFIITFNANCFLHEDSSSDRNNLGFCSERLIKIGKRSNAKVFSGKIVSKTSCKKTVENQFTIMMMIFSFFFLFA